MSEEKWRKFFKYSAYGRMAVGLAAMTIVTVACLFMWALPGSDFSGAESVGMALFLAICYCFVMVLEYALGLGAAWLWNKLFIPAKPIKKR